MSYLMNVLLDIAIITLLCSCAGTYKPDIQPANPIQTKLDQQIITHVGEIVNTEAGIARVEVVYTSALGQTCRKLTLINQNNAMIVECFDGGWHTLKDITGKNPVGK